MKSELRLKPHHLLPGEQVVGVWHNGELIATVTGADGPGVRVISKHSLATSTESVSLGLSLNIVRVMLDCE